MVPHTSQSCYLLAPLSNGHKMQLQPYLTRPLQLQLLKLHFLMQQSDFSVTEKTKHNSLLLLSIHHMLINKLVFRP